MRMPLVLLLLLGVAAASPASAQVGSFGQNKIQYRHFEWQVLAGERVDVYFYSHDDAIARVALAYAEESYRYLARRFNHEIASRIPLIVYASHADFEQTNILPFVPPEGVLGVTEFMKRRVAMPFRGSYAEFRHTLRHELVHVFQLSMLARQAALEPNARLPGTPLWWSEGLAEFLSGGQETRDRMVVRDLVLSGRLPSIAQLGMIYSPVVYPLGGELHEFLAERYGAWRAPLLYESLAKHGTFEAALAATYGRSVDQLGAEWHYALRQRFYPEVVGRRPLGLAGRRIVGSALRPVPWIRPDGGIDVLYLSARSGYTDIYRRPLEGGRAVPVVRGGRTPELESLRAFSSRLDLRNSVLLFATKFHDREALVFWDIEAERMVGRYQFDSLVSIVSPSWSPDGERVAFTGLVESGIADLYVFEIATGALRRVTDDRYQNLDPVWLPDGRSLVFSSDRAHGGDEGHRNLYVVRLEAGVISPLTSGPWVDESPRWDGDRGRVLFASDRDGTFNLWSVDTAGRARRETVVDGGVLDPVPIPGDPRVLVGGFEGMGWSIFALLPDPEAEQNGETAALAPADSSGLWEWSELADRSTAAVRAERYRRRFSLDIAAGGADVAPGWGTAQGAQILFTDMLGDHVIAANVALYARGTGMGDILSNLNGNLFYLNQQRRLNWGVGAFRLAGNFYQSDLRYLYRETTSGAYGTLRYPLSRFMRVEGQTRVEYSDRDDGNNPTIRGPAQRTGFLVSNYLSLVGDNALWLPTGPIDGTRWNVTAGMVGDVSHGVFENWLGTVDVRRYVRTSQQSAVAVRAYLHASEGTRPRAIPLGGSWLLRGYPRLSVDGTRAWLLNTEWRFPITNFVTVGFPFGAVRLPQVQGAIFTDAAQAWYDGDYQGRVLGSAGVGVRVPVVPGFVLRLDVGRRFAVGGGGADDPLVAQPRFVDFFFGYNY